jgi:acyl-CoA synthetase (AMP-forming)/AMP-acid ligase II
MTDAVPLLHDYLLASAARAPTKIALICEKRRWTYRELDRSSNALAHALVRRGVGHGDRVVVLSDNRAEALVAFWAVLKANAVFVPLHPHTKPDKLAYVLNASRAVALVTHRRLASIVCPHLRATIVIEDGWADVLRSEDQDSPPARRCLDIDVAAIFHTSKSTGEPRSTTLTHRNLLDVASKVSARLGANDDDVILGALPFSFDFGLLQAIVSVKAGARLVVEKGFVYLARTLNIIVGEGVTILPGVPLMFALLSNLRSLGDYDFSRVRWITSPAAASPLVRVAKFFENARISSTHGIMESRSETQPTAEGATP